MELPHDPNILVSMLNMKLRDYDYDTLDELFDELGFDKSEAMLYLKEKGFIYNESIKQFR